MSDSVSSNNKKKHNKKNKNKQNKNSSSNSNTMSNTNEKTEFFTSTNTTDKVDSSNTVENIENCKDRSLVHDDESRVNESLPDPFSPSLTESAGNYPLKDIPTPSTNYESLCGRAESISSTNAQIELEQIYADALADIENEDYYNDTREISSIPNNVGTCGDDVHMQDIYPSTTRKNDDPDRRISGRISDKFNPMNYLDAEDTKRSECLKMPGDDYDSINSIPTAVPYDSRGSTIHCATNSYELGECDTYEGASKSYAEVAELLVQKALFFVKESSYSSIQSSLNHVVNNVYLHVNYHINGSSDQCNCTGKDDDIIGKLIGTIMSILNTIQSYVPSFVMSILTALVLPVIKYFMALYLSIAIWVLNVTLWIVCLPYRLLAMAAIGMFQVVVYMMVAFLNKTPGGQTVPKALNGHVAKH